MNELSLKVRILTKKNTQGILKDLRNNGIKVEKITEGFYKCYDGKTEVFSAMIGRYNYLCRFNPLYFS